MEYDIDPIIGECPFLLSPCRVWCGFHVDGKCSWLTVEEAPDLRECAPCDPHMWRVRMIASIGR